MSDDQSPWPEGTRMCGVCGVRPATVTFPQTPPDPMCSTDYLAYARAQQEA
jgi:hypothetical protein